MTLNKKILALTPLCALLAGTAAHATNGYMPHGYGMKAMGMGGASTALAQDSMGGANNPASMVWVGNRLDAGVNLFQPVREAERSGAAMPTLNGTVRSERENFLIPEFGYNRMLRSDLSAGVSVYGNGGMNTTYPQGNFNCGGGAADMLCGSGALGVDLMQLIIAPTVAFKIDDKNSLGASLLLGYQQFKAQGLQAFDNAPGFPAMTGAPGSVTNRGTDSASGSGLRVGYMGKLNERVTVGASYSTKVNMSKFDKYKGLFANGGDFDMPSSYSVGIAYAPDEKWTLAMDYGRIQYSGVPAVGNPSSAAAPLGAANGPGFGWTDVKVLKLGAAWRMSAEWTLRAGYNKGSNPVNSRDVTFNVLAPGVITTHYTAGFTYALSKENELTGALMIAPTSSTSGASLFNNFMGAGAAGNEAVRMHQMSFGLAFGHKF